MPLVTIASAISLISFSLTLQANLFQLFQPIGGVFARPLSCACTLVPQQASNKRRAISVFIFSHLSLRSSAFLCANHHFSTQRSQRSQRYAEDRRESHGTRIVFLSLASVDEPPT